MDKALLTSGINVEIVIDDKVVSAREGEPLAAVFLRQDDIHTRTSNPSSEPRAPFCMMGVCFECVVHVDGVGTVRSCQQSVRDGMRVVRQDQPKRLK
ncbi:(2Fe-2S)-binding protein [Rhizobium sp. RAF36]|uniref:(2Fe-2S)-binding protein n=1 Tax=Rhizobium sp. RAF36 TaxID=3233055 RepID=UPI003F9DE310